jgi:virginiamycin A acetyltransferase
MFARITRLVIKRLRRDEFESRKLRDIFRREYDIEIGMYSYGCFDPDRIASGTRFGRYCSVAPSATIFSRNHGLNFISLHPYLYNSNLGVIEKDTIDHGACVVEDDVWLGHNSIVTPNVQLIGRGAVVAAGAVVTRDVPRYAIVAGNPARVLRYRFSQEVIEKIEKTRWWELGKDELKNMTTENPGAVFMPAKNL